jgi:transcriptional regulator with XRE-family HTH domain
LALGGAIREIRAAAGLTQRQLADRLHHPNNTRIALWETGKRPPSEADAASVLAVLDVSGIERDRLLAMAREVADQNWLAPSADAHFAEHVDYERSSRTLTVANVTGPPGLVQTADYARSIMISDGLTAGEAEQFVLMRMARRDVITGPDAKPLVAYIGEYAIRHMPCPPGIALGQLRALEHWAQQPNVTIQAIPYAAGWTPAHAGAFMLLEFEKARDVILVDHYASSMFLTAKQDTARYRTAVDKIHRVAMSPEDTSRLIAEVVQEMEQ